MVSSARVRPVRPEDQPYMALAEVAAYLGVTRQVAYYWSQRSDFPAPGRRSEDGAGLDHRRHLEVQGGHGREPPLLPKPLTSAHAELVAPPTQPALRLRG